MCKKILTAVLVLLTSLVCVMGQMPSCHVKFTNSECWHSFCTSYVDVYNQN